MENLNLNYMVVCGKAAPMFGSTFLERVTSIDNFDLAPSLKNVGAVLAFGVAIPNGESHYILDFKVILPDGKKHHLDRQPVGKLGNNLILQGQIEITSNFTQKGFYVYQAYYEDRLLGQYVFEAR